MKNKFLDYFTSTIMIKITGKNIERFLHRLVHAHIDLLEVKQVHYNEVWVKIRKDEYERVLEIKTIYDIEVVDYFGAIKIKKLTKKNTILIGCIFICLCFLFFLSNVMFQIEVIHNDSNIREMLLSELGEYGVKTKTIKKSYNELQQIKKKILEEHKNEIEWLEIEIVGTKYIVRVEERKLNEKKENIPIRNIVAKKHAILKHIDAKHGEIVRDINTYVNPGDVVISGDIKLNEESKNKTGADGKIYGEVWYQTKVEMPYEYHEKNYTGRKKKVYALKILNKQIEFFNFHPFKQVESDSKKLLFHPLLPISLTLEHQKEVIKKDVVYTEEEALNEAIKRAKEKIESSLDKKEYIIGQKNLKVDMRNSKIVVDVFFSVYEDITSYQEIPEEIVEDNNDRNNNN